MKNPQLVVNSTFDRIQARNGLGAKNQSQMNKLLPMLELAAKKEVPAELVQQKFEHKIVACSVLLVDVLQKTKKSLRTVRDVDHQTQMKKLTLGIKRIDKAVAAKVPQGTAKCLRAAINELVSIREGVYTQTPMTDDDWSTPVLDQAIATVTEVRTATEKALQQHKDQQSGVDAEQQEELRMYSDFEAILATTRVAASKASLESIRNKPFVVIQAPVIPMPKKGVLDPSKFKAAGFDCESMAGYPMFRSQMVVGINRSMLDMTDKEREKGAAIPRERVFKAAAQVKRMIEKQTGKRLHFVDERPHGASGGSWFWLMAEREVDAFARCCPGGQIQLLNFGFAL